MGRGRPLRCHLCEPGMNVREPFSSVCSSSAMWTVMWHIGCSKQQDAKADRQTQTHQQHGAVILPAARTIVRVQYE